MVTKTSTLFSVSSSQETGPILTADRERSLPIKTSDQQRKSVSIIALFCVSTAMNFNPQ